jgi:tetratricopeptide (TPR) repeat protein
LKDKRAFSDTQNMGSLPRPQILDHADAMIRSGRISSARDALQAVSPTQLLRCDRLDFAKICRRVGLVALGLKCLKPVIHPQKVDDEPAAPAELAEYAVLLSRVGATQEALKILDSKNVRPLKETGLYAGFAHVSDWDYEKAQKAFETFLSQDNSAYSNLVGRVNLAACLVYNEDPLARTFLDETIQLAEVYQADRLRANCYELRGHAHLSVDAFTPAEDDFQRAVELFGELKVADQLLVQKGIAVLQSKREKSPVPLLEFRQASLAKASWENCREVDFLFLKDSFSVESFLQLYFGTPYAGFRKRMERHFRMPAPDFATIGSGTTPLDLTDVEIPRKTQSVLLALARDAYAPSRTGRLFSEIYPDEYFDIHSSPVRVRKQISRARNWLFDHHPGFKIQFENGGSRLILPSEGSLYVPKNSVDPRNDQLHRLEIVFGQHFFSAQEVCETLSVSRISSLRLINWAKECGLILISGTGRATRYQILSNPKLLARNSSVA